MYSKVKEIFYFIGLFLMLLRAMIENSNLIELNNIVDIIIICLTALFLGLKILMEKYTIKEFSLIVVIGIFCIYTSFVCDYFTITMSFLTLVGLKNINLSKLLKFIGCTIGTYLLICFISFLWTFITNETSLSYYAITSYNMKRYYINFKNPNLFAILVFWMMAIYLYLLREKKSIIKYVIYLLVNGISYYFTFSKTALALSIFLLIAFICIDKNFKIANKKLLLVLAKYIFILFALFSLLSITCYNIFPDFFNSVDNLLSRRISLGAIAFNRYGITLLPRPIELPIVSWTNRYTMQLVLDNAYIKALINIGAVYIFIIYYIILKGLKCENDKYELVLIIIMSISAISESYIYSCYICFPMIILVSKIFEKIEKNKRIYETKKLSDSSDGNKSRLGDENEE